MSESRIHIVVGLCFGDEGKGSIVDYLVRQDEAVGTVVRFNGGPQAAHRVVDSDGRSHVCSQFGAGILVPGVRTHLARGMLVNPPNLLAEYQGLRRLGIRDGFARLSIDPECVVVTPFHVLANRALELARGDGRHGSCGQGVGEARRDELDGHVLRVHECMDRWTLLPKLRELQEVARAKLEGVEIPQHISPARDPRWVLEAWDALYGIERVYRDWRWLASAQNPDALADAFDRGHVVFEGAQGVLLDETYGFHPYTTWTDTTTAPALALLDEHDRKGEARTIGVTRAYATRHGAGPLPTEDATLTERLPDAENGTGDWQGAFRVGWFDLPMLRYALDVCPVDAIALTCLDRVADFGGEWVAAVMYEGREPFKPLPRCNPYEHCSRLTDEVANAKPMLIPLEPSAYAYGWVLRNFLDVPLEIVSMGPTAADKTLAPLVEAAA